MEWTAQLQARGGWAAGRFEVAEVTYFEFDGSGSGVFNPLDQPLYSAELPLLGD